MENKNNKIDFWHELFMTFSVKKSLLSSKKIERFVIFGVLMSMTIFYVIKNIDEMSSLGFVEICLMWLGYAGYNTVMNHRDKLLDRKGEDEEA